MAGLGQNKISSRARSPGGSANPNEPVANVSARRVLPLCMADYGYSSLGVAVFGSEVVTGSLYRHGEVCMTFRPGLRSPSVSNAHKRILRSPRPALGDVSPPVIRYPSSSSCRLRL
jgi:hypothetical protein